MDYNLGFWARDLDHYVRLFNEDGVSYYTLDWELEGAKYYSVFVWITGSQVVFEPETLAQIRTRIRTRTLNGFFVMWISDSKIDAGTLTPMPNKTRWSWN